MSEENQPSSAEKQLASAAKLLASADNPLVSADNPLASEEPQLSVEEKPVGADNLSGNADNHLSSVEKKQSSVEPQLFAEETSWQDLPNEDAALDILKSWKLAAESEAQLFAYCRLLHEFDSHTNLVANSSLPVLLKEHVLDSLQLLPWIRDAKRHSPRLVDVGTGAGFPGLVLAIAHPLLKLTLVESIGKKCRFLESVVTALELSSRVQILCERAETLGHDRKLREKFDFATARAVGALPMVAEFCLPFLRVGGTLLAQRSKRQAVEEYDEADAYFSRLGGLLVEPVDFEPDLLGRELSVFVVAKKRATPPSYPRNAAQIKKAR